MLNARNAWRKVPVCLTKAWQSTSGKVRSAMWTNSRKTLNDSPRNSMDDKKYKCKSCDRIKDHVDEDGYCEKCQCEREDFEER